MKLEDLIKELTEMAEGQEMAAEAEIHVINGLSPARNAFLKENDRSPHVMRQLRVYNEASNNQRRWANESKALRLAIEILQKGLMK
jgi:hypothetical protein